GPRAAPPRRHRRHIVPRRRRRDGPGRPRPGHWAGPLPPRRPRSLRHLAAVLAPGWTRLPGEFPERARRAMMSSLAPLLGRRAVVALGGLLIAVVTPERAGAQVAPSTYSAYTGTDAKPAPPAPALGPANSVVTDPTFGSRILRVTDQNSGAGKSFIPTDAGFFRTWNANATAIK